MFIRSIGWIAWAIFFISTHLLAAGDEFVMKRGQLTEGPYQAGDLIVVHLENKGFFVASYVGESEFSSDLVDVALGFEGTERKVRTIMKSEIAGKLQSEELTSREVEEFESALKPFLDFPNGFLNKIGSLGHSYYKLIRPIQQILDAQPVTAHGLRVIRAYLKHVDSLITDDLERGRLQNNTEFKFAIADDLEMGLTLQNIRENFLQELINKIGRRLIRLGDYDLGTKVLFSDLGRVKSARK